MPCQEWCRLVERYRIAVHAYNEAVNPLGTVPGTAFNELWSRAESERAKCGRRRADLLHHEHEHACLDGAHPIGKRVSGLKTENLVLGDQGQSGG